MMSHDLALEGERIRGLNIQTFPIYKRPDIWRFELHNLRTSRVSSACLTTPYPIPAYSLAVSASLLRTKDRKRERGGEVKCKNPKKQEGLLKEVWNPSKRRQTSTNEKKKKKKATIASTLLDTTHLLPPLHQPRIIVFKHFTSRSKYHNHKERSDNGRPRFPPTPAHANHRNRTPAPADRHAARSRFLDAFDRGSGDDEVYVRMLLFPPHCLLSPAIIQLREKKKKKKKRIGVNVSVEGRSFVDLLPSL